MIRLLLDQGLPRSSAALLRERGIDAVHVGECGMSQASDPAILDFARVDQRIVVTLDADFHALLALSNAKLPSVIRLRIEGLRGVDAAKLIELVAAQITNELLGGAIVAVTTKGVRVKRLPILG